MDHIPHPPLSRIPGTTVVKENHTKILANLTRAELLEIKERESKLLANASRLKLLPDKGKRVWDYYAKVVAELEARDNVDEAAAILSELNIASKGKEVLNKLEWNGHLTNEDNADPSADLLDSDDENEMEPLRVIAQHSMHEKRRVNVLPSEIKNPLITQEDLAEIESFKTESPDSGLGQAKETSPNSSNESAVNTSDVIEAQLIDFVVKIEKVKEILEKPKVPPPTSKEIPENNINLKDKMATSLDMELHTRYLIDKTEKSEPQREKFMPYKSTISNVHDPDKERVRKIGKHWEVTAATPPLIQRKPAQFLSLTDSVQLQCDYLAKLKTLQEQQAEERLARKIERLHKLELPITAPLSDAFKVYRTPRPEIAIEGSMRIPDELEQVHDPLDVERANNSISYTYTD